MGGSRATGWVAETLDWGLPGSKTMWDPPAEGCMIMTRACCSRNPSLWYGESYVRLNIGTRTTEGKEEDVWEGAHRLACWLNNTYKDASPYACHVGPAERVRKGCKDPHCVHPSHIEWETQESNVAQGVKKRKRGGAWNKGM